MVLAYYRITKTENVKSAGISYQLSGRTLRYLGSGAGVKESMGAWEFGSKGALGEGPIPTPRGPRAY
jgi:hypothetical protein